MATEPIDNSDNQTSESQLEEHDALPEAIIRNSDDDADLSEMDVLKNELAIANDQVVRTHAELDNFRKRSRRDLQDQLKFSTVPVMRELVDVLDNLTRALDAADQKSDEGLVQGVRLVADQLSGVLESHECKRIETVGQVFDPNLHESVQMVPSDDYPEGTVVREIQAGYHVHDRVVRPAKVFVAAASK